MLRWIQQYLKDRKYKVFLEGEYSTEYTMSSGVPQGSILSPTLFNVMMSSIPHCTEVSMSEYADDILIYSSSSNIQDVTKNIQKQINLLVKWFENWGFRLNENKTKAMMMTLKRIDTPKINISNTPIEFVDKYKYLGMIIDGPRLSWASHIKTITEKCIPKVNLMKAISNHHWGADRDTLDKIYKSLVRSLIDYGSMFYSTASATNLNTLNKIQNNCLRLILGARKTSPIISLEVESHIPPLHIHRNSVMINNLSLIHI